jgi:hypothetical protein
LIVRLTRSHAAVAAGLGALRTCIQGIANGANAEYNSFSIKVTRRFTRGFSLVSSWTWAKSIDDTSGIRPQSYDNNSGIPQNSYCINPMRARPFRIQREEPVRGLRPIRIAGGHGADTEHSTTGSSTPSPVVGRPAVSSHCKAAHRGPLPSEAWITRAPPAPTVPTQPVSALT